MTLGHMHEDRILAEHRLLGETPFLIQDLSSPRF